MRDKILVADSNEANREILVELFEDGFKVLEASTGEQVIDILRREHSVSMIRDISHAVRVLRLVTVQWLV